MKINFKLFLALIPATILFCGCPKVYNYSLGESGTEKIDRQLLGSWTNIDPKADVPKVVIYRDDDYRYTIDAVTSDFESELFNAWPIKISNKTILCVEEPEENVFFYFSCEVKGKTMTTYSLLLENADEIKSEEEFQKIVKEAVEKGNGFTEKSVWVKN